MWQYRALGAVPLALVLSGAGCPGISPATQSDSSSVRWACEEEYVVTDDGSYVCILENANVHFVRISPVEEMAEVANLQVGGTGDSLFLHGNKLVVLSLEELMMDDKPVRSKFRFGDSVSAFVTVIDISDPAGPTVEVSIHFDRADGAGGVLLDNRLYLAVSTYNYSSDWDLPVETWGPQYELKAADGSVLASGPVVTKADMAGSQDADRDLTAVLTLDVDAPTKPFRVTGFGGSADSVYAGSTDLYVYSHSWGGGTDLHKLAYAPEGTTYLGSVRIGSPMNGNSLDEYRGYLRVASTGRSATDPVTRQHTYTAYVHVIGEAADGAPVIVGQADGIVSEMYATARFAGDRCFLTDPLVTVDVSDPTAPRVAGQLNDAGDVIGLLDDTHLLTFSLFGAPVECAARISVIDVTDLANLVLLHREVIGGPDASERVSPLDTYEDPAGFTYSAERGVLAVPLQVSRMTGPDDDGYYDREDEFAGLCIYRVTAADGFQFLGRISADNHPGSIAADLGLFIGDIVYSIGPYVRAASLDDMETILGEARPGVVE